MEALHLIHKLVPGRQRRYRLSSHGLNRSVDSILDGLDGSKRRASYPANSEVNMLFSFSAKESLILQFKYMIVICRILRWKSNLNAMAFTMVCLVKTKPHEKLWKSDFRRGAFNLVSYLSCCHSVIISVSKILKYITVRRLLCSRPSITCVSIGCVSDLSPTKAIGLFGRPNFHRPEVWLRRPHLEFLSPSTFDLSL